MPSSVLIGLPHLYFIRVPNEKSLHAELCFFPCEYRGKFFMLHSFCMPLLLKKALPHLAKFLINTSSDGLYDGVGIFLRLEQ